MLFNSLVFLLLFCPAAFVAVVAGEAAGPRWRLRALLLVSLAFYAAFDLRFVPLLLLSAGLNWLAGETYLRTKRKAVVALAIGLDLLALAFYKYLAFLFGLAGAAFGIDLPAVTLAFPVGISFFTFQHVMYLSDLVRGRTARVDLETYALSVAFFPKVTAGPLVRMSEFAPQLAGTVLGPGSTERIARALLLLGLGLGKKVLLGDELAPGVNAIWSRIADGQVLSMSDAWQVTLGYTFQLYFDFSGYTDMALGIALLLGIRLPQNFDAPYRSTSLQDFWRRWHITLSTFLRDYLYIPFGGNRHGMPRQVLALFATMALGGLWHGAGLTFVVWGALHGIGLGIGLVWHKAGLRLPAPIGWVLTFAFVALAWVLFRAPSFEAARLVYAGLVGVGPLGEGLDWPLLAVAALAAIAGPTAQALSERARPVWWVAVGGGLATAALLLKIGDDANLDFIYAQF